METTLATERTPGTVDADPGCDTAKEAPEAAAMRAGAG